MPSTEAALMEKCLKAWRFLYRRGFIEGFGHLSVRIPGTDNYMLTRHSLGPIITPDDMLVYDASGTQLGGIGDRPGEAPIHHEIYRSRPDVHSIIHYHGMHATAFSTSELTYKPIHIMGTLFARGLDPDQRAALGAQYTSRDDIVTLVEPVLMDPLRREWAELQASLLPAFNRGKGSPEDRARLARATLAFTRTLSRPS